MTLKARGTVIYKGRGLGEIVADVLQEAILNYFDKEDIEEVFDAALWDELNEHIEIIHDEEAKELFTKKALKLTDSEDELFMAHMHYNTLSFLKDVKNIPNDLREKCLNLDSMKELIKVLEEIKED